MASFSLSRRALLRAGAFTVGLPLLEAMVGRAAAATGAPPVRLINFFWPNGVNLVDFVKPTSVSRQALSGVAGDVNLITGLRNDVIGNFQEGGALGPLGSHGCGGAGFATSVHVTSSGAGGPSFEQVAAASLGGATRFKSLVVSGQTRIYLPPHFHNQSWVGKNNAAEPTRDPLKAYDLLFSTPVGTGTPQPSQLLRDRKSVLDFVKGDAARLSAKLGATDKARLDEHLTAIRTLEQQLAAIPPPPVSTCTQPARPADPGADVAKRASLYSALIARAFACDLTRFVTFQLTDAMYEGQLVADPAAANDHDLSHGTSAASIALIIKSTQFKLTQLANLITALKSVPEGSGTLLDNTAIFASSEIGDSAAHGWQNMPVITAGKGGGRIPTGRTLSYSNRSVADLFASFLTVAGVPTSQFGDGVGPLPGLIA